MDVIKEYARLKKIHRLPDFMAVDDYFEITEIECSGHLLRRIRERIVEKMDYALTPLTKVLHPETDLEGMYESKFFRDEDHKNKVYSLYKRLMKQVKYSDEVSVGDSDKENVAFIKDSTKFWSENRKELRGILSDIKDFWATNPDIKEDLSYLG